MFSPYYAWARRRGPADPENHCALNVALYGAAGKRWTMTERGRRHMSRTADAFTVGPSALAWDGTALTIHIAETGMPIPRAVRGTVRVHPQAIVGQGFALDPDGRHRWWPIAPLARVEVALEAPALRWRGHAYLDCNAGDEPLEAGFVGWDWSRAPLKAGAAVLYEGIRRGGAPFALALAFDAAGGVAPFAPPPPALLPRSGWRIARATRCEPGTPARVIETLEDTPFYARSLVETRLAGETATAVHESLSLDRFRRPIVQAMLPFRMPRRG